MHKKYTQGVTMVELLTVMSILLVVAALFVGVGGPARESAKKKKAKVMVSALQIAVEMYRTNTGLYPPTDDSNTCSKNLYDALTNTIHSVVGYSTYIPGWAGPYIQFKNEDLDTTSYGGVATTKIIDPWKLPYQYRQPGTYDANNKYEIWSYGPDLRSGSTAWDYDNITSW